jgi:hypothetical protein
MMKVQQCSRPILPLVAVPWSPKLEARLRQLVVDPMFNNTAVMRPCLGAETAPIARMAGG